MLVPEEMSRDELIALVGVQAAQIAALRAMNEELAAKLARVEHLLSRNSGNSSMPPSKDDDPGRRPPAANPRRQAGGPRRSRGKQPGAVGANLAWAGKPDDQVDRFPQGRCECGHDLAEATDLGIVVLRDRQADVLRFAHDLRVPPTSNQAERDLRPAKIQQKISGRLTSEQRTKDRYRIRGYLSTAAKHGHNMMDALREAILGHPWIPPNPAAA